MRTGARPAGKSPARDRARVRKGKKSSPRGPQQIRPELASERACASAHRRPPSPLRFVAGLAHCSAVPDSPQARALGVSTSRFAEREEEGPPKESRRRTGLGEREKPPSEGEERGNRVGVCRRHASIPHAPRGCGSALETRAARRRQVDYLSQKATRYCACYSQQHLRARFFQFAAA